MTRPAEEKRSPFDLSNAIELLRSLPSYPTRLPSVVNIPSLSQLKPATSSDLQQKIFSRPNPFLDALSSPPPPAKVETYSLLDFPQTFQQTTPTKLSRRARRKLLDASQQPPTSPDATQVLSRKAREEAWKSVLSILQDHARLSQQLPVQITANGDVLSTFQIPRVAYEPAIHVFVDYSNISIGYSNLIKWALVNTPFQDTFTPQISFATLARIFQGDRACQKKALVGSSEGPAIAEARRLGYDTSILQRVPARVNKKPDSDPESTGRSKLRRHAEQAVDEVLIMKIQDSLLEHSPSTIVLATGDGNVAEFSDGFFGVVERCLKRGWNVELFSFHHNLSSSWRTIVDPKFRIFLLDLYLPELTRLIPNMPPHEKRKRETGEDSDVQRSKH
ncbi:hypothetical protein TWF696_000394 [Orbilia brochopaga]|uniref:NYN domain-containing protein n=1 Tax=Orbilia brochopaga TaxID=3140254 RepID=A0AAV9VHI8_9PEZI